MWNTDDQNKMITFIRNITNYTEQTQSVDELIDQALKKRFKILIYILLAIPIQNYEGLLKQERKDIDHGVFLCNSYMLLLERLRMTNEYPDYQSILYLYNIEDMLKLMFPEFYNLYRNQEMV